MTIDKRYDIIIVGGSITAIEAINSIHEINPHTKILLISGEDRLPYKRTMINKNIVRGFDKDDFKLATNEWYQQNNVTLIIDRATKIDRKQKSLETATNGTYTYNKLLLATGVRSKTLKYNNLAHNDYYRVQNASDVEKLLKDIKHKQSFLIIGSGVEGIETADQLIRKGKNVTIIDRNNRPMRKLLPEEYSNELISAMKNKGVHYLPNTSINSVNRIRNQQYEVTFGDSKQVFDGIISCIGTQANIELAQEANLKTNKGILVNNFLQTSDPDIYAGGDVAEHSNGTMTTLWHAAAYQGEIAGLNMMSISREHKIKPFRLKTDVFGLFLFSANFENVNSGQYEISCQQQGNLKRTIYYKNDETNGIIMMNDKNRAKEYQQAVMEKWSKEKFNNSLPIQQSVIFSFAASFK